LAHRQKQTDWNRSGLAHFFGLFAPQLNRRFTSSLCRETSPKLINQRFERIAAANYVPISFANQNFGRKY